MPKYLVLYKSNLRSAYTTGQYIIIEAGDEKECLTKWYEIMNEKMAKNVKSAMERYQLSDNKSLQILIDFINSISRYDKVYQVIRYSEKEV